MCVCVCVCVFGQKRGQLNLIFFNFLKKTQVKMPPSIMRSSHISCFSLASGSWNIQHLYHHVSMRLQPEECVVRAV
jgi:hypothetical protein